MYNFFKAVFGIPPNELDGFRMDGDQQNDFRNHFRRGDDDDDDDDDDGHHNTRSLFDGNIGTFDVRLFSDPIEMHKYFEGLVNEMHKKFETFGCQNGPGIMWEDNQRNSSFFFNEEPTSKSGALRDTFLKNPGYVKNAKKEDVDLDGQVKVDDVENFLRRAAETPNEVQTASPKVFSKSICIRRIRRPDGTIETVKKVRDHTGKEETTITQNNVNNPQLQPQDGHLILNDDIAGISLFKKFFPF